MESCQYIINPLFNLKSLSIIHVVKCQNILPFKKRLKFKIGLEPGTTHCNSAVLAPGHTSSQAIKYKETP